MRIQSDALNRLVRSVFLRAGSEPSEAGAIADHLIDANLKGHDSHGVSRVIRYVQYLEEGNVFPNQTLTVVFESDTLAVADGNWGYGQALGGAAVKLGVDKARGAGVCCAISATSAGSARGRSLRPKTGSFRSIW